MSAPMYVLVGLKRCEEEMIKGQTKAKKFK
jgi:hypothetical protein